MLNGLQSQYNGPLDLVELLVMAAPALIGIFWGAPLIAAELERGTHYLAWNQSVTRTRWLAVKLAIVGLASVLTAGLLSLLVTWWASPLDTISGSRFGTQTFDARNIAPLGYAAFAFALGVTLGLLIRRTLPAMAATLAIFIAVQVLVTAEIRPNLLPSTTIAVPVNQTTMSQAIRFDRPAAVTGPVTIDLPTPDGAWVLSQTPALNSSGQVIQTSEILSCWSRGLVTGAAGKGGLRASGRSEPASHPRTSTSRSPTNPPAGTGRCSGSKPPSTPSSPRCWPPSASGASADCAADSRSAGRPGPTSGRARRPRRPPAAAVSEPLLDSHVIAGTPRRPIRIIRRTLAHIPALRYGLRSRGCHVLRQDRRCR